MRTEAETDTPVEELIGWHRSPVHDFWIPGKASSVARAEATVDDLAAWLWDKTGWPSMVWPSHGNHYEIVNNVGHGPRTIGEGPSIRDAFIAAVRKVSK